MEINLNSEIISQLSSKGVLAYVAVSLAVGTEATTAALAGLVKVQTAAMLEGLKEVSTVAPELVAKAPKNRWRCGVIKAGEGVVLQNLDSNRFRDFVDDLKKYWEHLNPITPPFQMGGKDGVQIRKFLNDHPDWTSDNWRSALKSRATSVVRHGLGTRSEPLWVWVGVLDAYASGPIDKFKNQVGNGKAAEAANRNREAAAEFLGRN